VGAAQDRGHPSVSVVIKSGVKNLRNLHVWATDDYVIGLYEKQDRLGGAQYADFIEETLPLLLQIVRLHGRKSMRFQHGGALPHSARQVRKWLDNVPDRWIGRGGPIVRPPRSPDLTP
jgi:hypothetical protein